jgi:hypothetical protein
MHARGRGAERYFMDNSTRSLNAAEIRAPLNGQRRGFTVRILQLHGRSMGLFSFIHWLLTGPRLARRQTIARTVCEFMHRKLRKGFFGATSPRCELQPVRAKISKDRRR